MAGRRDGAQPPGELIVLVRWHTGLHLPQVMRADRDEQAVDGAEDEPGVRIRAVLNAEPADTLVDEGVEDRRTSYYGVTTGT